jgi:hypothetical protein
MFHEATISLEYMCDRYNNPAVFELYNMLAPFC